jgi:hypothetical protein
VVGPITFVLPNATWAESTQIGAAWAWLACGITKAAVDPASTAAAEAARIKRRRIEHLSLMSL